MEVQEEKCRGAGRNCLGIVLPLIRPIKVGFQKAV